MLSQVIRFTLPQLLTASTPEFLKLRQAATAAGAIAQYFGYTIPVSGAGLPKRSDEVCWAIQWPDARNRDSLTNQLVEMASEEPVSISLEFPDTQYPDFVRALEAPVCEFACIRLSDNAPLSDSSLQSSMHKTYSDTFKIQGFTGGYWAYASNTNNSSGLPLQTASLQRVPETERRLGVYLLGWESIEHHQRGTKTEVFAEELTKLMPYFGPGTGAWYVKFEKH
ncbi:hypothetical protein BGZ63DRAFT_415688 [Mariannaea sp. PMI_226]|nr:hypothetical protein BGZ63DRAFT_415688 [Mariannaea sp. PMI_226]